MRTPRREFLRKEGLALLDLLCQDSLEQPLSTARTHPEQGHIAATFALLAVMIEELTEE